MAKNTTKKTASTPAVSEIPPSAVFVKFKNQFEACGIVLAWDKERNGIEIRTTGEVFFNIKELGPVPKFGDQ